jgi:hypothetical protein
MQPLSQNAEENLQFAFTMLKDFILGMINGKQL